MSYTIHLLRPAVVVLLFCGVVRSAVAGDWNVPAQQLARKIVAVTGPGAVAVNVENRSSLGKKDLDAIAGLLRSELEAAGARPAAEQSAATAMVTLSENPQSYVWVAEIHQGAGESAVVMVSMPRRDLAGFGQEIMPVTLRKIPLWAQEDRILDVLVIEEDSAPKQIAVLDGEKIALYRLKNGKWQQEQVLGITHARPWPLDLRGRVIASKDHLFDVYLPGVFCRSTTSLPLALNCRESDDPWPLTSTDATIPPLGGFYSSSRNFFTGALTPGVGKLTTVGKFYSAAAVPRDKYVLWFFAGTNGQTHLVDGMTDQSAKLGLGSDVASVRTACGTGWQVLATSAEGSNLEQDSDSLRAYDVTDRELVPVSSPLNFSGEITALWAEAKGGSAIAVVRSRETGEYEAFRLAVGCSQ